MSFKHLFSKSLAAGGDRLHFAAHSHHLWPDVSFDAQVEAWEDAARLADRKWDKVMGEVWPEAQAEVAAELGTGDSSAIVFSSNTHDFVVRLAAACPRRDPARLRVLTSDGEFHSSRRQFARWAEDEWLVEEKVAAEPFDDFSERFLAAARRGRHDLIFVSHVLFGSGRIVDILDELAGLATPDGPWVVVDGYHSFMALDAPMTPALGAKLFFLGGGYKYAMAGEGLGFLHCPPDFGPRPPITGWYAEFGDLKAPPGGVGYTSDAMRFMGATFDPTVFYRFTAIRRMLRDEGLTTADISAKVAALHAQTVAALAPTVLGNVELLNPIDGGPHARFLALRSPDAQRWQKELLDRNCVTDVRGDVLRIGLGLYHDPDDIDRLAGIAGSLD